MQRSYFSSILKASNVDEVYLRMINPSEIQMTIAGSDSIDRARALDFAVALCNLANADLISEVDVVKECRSNLQIVDLLLDGQPGNSPSSLNGFIQKYNILIGYK